MENVIYVTKYLFVNSNILLRKPTLLKFDANI